MSGFSIKTITETEISASDSNGAWCKVRLQEDPGSVVILSDYGNWSNFWQPAHRSQKLPEFLAGLDADYAGGKFLGAGLDVYDEDRTRKTIAENILQSRREGDLSKDEARTHWNEIDLLDAGFDAWCQETTLPDAWEWGYGTIMEPDWRNFWDRLWVPFVVPALRELSKEQ